MGKIVILDENTANKIAAGEVIERPASAVKELVENSIDAGASAISVEIKNGGISYIKVMDNGTGMDEDDVEIAFERHSTSKIRNANDLESIATLGFRGEALASIAAVSRVQLTTRVQKNPHGTFIEIHGGAVRDVKQVGCPVGTVFVIKELFYNTPARFKFLKKDSTEAGYVSDIISRIALGNPHISFKLTSNGSTIIHTPGNNDLLSAIFSVYGKETAREVYRVDYADSKIKIQGYAGKPEIARSNRNHQSIYINGRYVRSRTVTSAMEEAYRTFLLKNKFPFAVLTLEVNPLFVDVNVHPAKMEVRFSNEQDIFRAVYHAVTNALLSQSRIRTVQLDKKPEETFKIEEKKQPPVEYTQQSFEMVQRPIKETPDTFEVGDINNGIQFNYAADVLQSVKPSGTEKIEVKEKPAEYRPPKEATPENALKIDADILPGIQGKTDREGDILRNSRIIGQAFSTYIILQHGDELLMIDQHAAHERIMFERMKICFMRNESLAQMLIAPLAVELTHQELKFLEEHINFFNQLGFIYENFGNNSIILRSVPYTDPGGMMKETFLDILDHVMNTGRLETRAAAEETLYTIACKAAVKANKKLDDSEIKGIIEELSRLQNLYTCPHGRPTVIRITKYEIEKKFKRII